MNGETMTGPDKNNQDRSNQDAGLRDGQNRDAHGATTAKPSAGKTRPAPESKEDRLGAALRANLRRRKAQARGRKSDDNPV